MKKKGKQKAMSFKRVEVIFTGIEWLIYISFCIIAGIFMKDVLDQYQAKDTFMSQSLESITKLPTLVICDEAHADWSKFDGKIEMQFGFFINDFHTLEDHKPLKIEGGYEVFFEQFSKSCFKVKTLASDSQIKTGHVWKLKVVFPNQSNEVVPSYLSFFYTSEENSYGALRRQWFDGEVFDQRVERGNWILTTLKPVQYKYLKHDGQCSDETFLEQWSKHISRANFSGCPRKCSSHSFLVSDDLPLCGWKAEETSGRQCAEDALLRNYEHFRTTIGYTRPCNPLEYIGRKAYEGSEANNTFMVRYQFAPPEKTLHYRELLVFDVVGMVGSVGGTLGMCIGFSFSGITSSVLDIIKSLMKASY